MKFSSFLFCSIFFITFYTCNGSPKPQEEDPSVEVAGHTYNAINWGAPWWVKKDQERGWSAQGLGRSLRSMSELAELKEKIREVEEPLTGLSAEVRKKEITSLPRATETRAEQGGGLGSAFSGFQSGLSSVMNSSNMKESRLVMGGFSFIIVPSPDMSQISQMNPSQLPQIPSLPGGKK